MTRPKSGRRIPRPAELAPLLRTRDFTWDATERRLAKAMTIDDLRRIARRRSPRAVFDYTDGGAEQEISIRRSRAALDRVEFGPRVLKDVSTVDTTAELFGRRSPLPLVLAPTGFTRMMHHEGELAVARAAQAAGLTYTLSTMGTRGIEEVAQAAPRADLWFQLYLWRDREASRNLLERARAAGYTALVVTVDTPVAGSRLRDVYNGMTIPPSLTPKTFLDGAIRPHWWFNFLTTEPLGFASLSTWNGTVEQLANKMFDPSATLDDVARLRSEWDRTLLVKGIQHVDDARRVIEAGADGIVLSNHGGRQLDRAPVPLEQLPSIRDALGPQPRILVDGGFRSGADIAAAVGMGADAVMVGRAYLYGLMAGGERGVTRALEILGGDFRRTMQLTGAQTVADLRDDRARLRPGG
jgi:L-lactate dehydrogenase (cytochrome)